MKKDNVGLVSQLRDGPIRSVPESPVPSKIVRHYLERLRNCIRESGVFVPEREWELIDNGSAYYLDSDQFRNMVEILIQLSSGHDGKYRCKYTTYGDGFRRFGFDKSHPNNKRLIFYEKDYRLENHLRRFNEF